MCRIVRSLLVLACLVTGLASSLPRADAKPVRLALQGSLQNIGGGPVADGSYPLAVRIYELASGGDYLFQDFSLGVAVKGGLFAFTLGADPKNPLDDGLFTSSKGQFAGVQVGSDPELPRVELAPVAYASRATLAAIAKDLECSGCVGAADLGEASVGTAALADSAVTGAKVAAGAVSSSHVDFTYAGSDTKGGEATLAKLALALQCTGCVGTDLLADGAVTKAKLAPTIGADLGLVDKAALASVATSGKYADLEGGPDLSPYAKTSDLAAYAALDGANAFSKVQTLSAGGALGGNLDFQKNVAMNLRLQSADKAPATCDGTTLGLVYYNTAMQQLLLCDGKNFKLVAFVGEVGTQQNPGITCKDILAKNPGAKDGLYYIKPASSTFQVQCDMSTDGGGWTVIARYTFAGGPDWIAGNNAKEGKIWRSDLGLASMSGTGSYSHDVAKFLGVGLLDDKAAFAVRSGSKLLKGTGFSWLAQPVYDSTPHHTRHGAVTLDGAAVTLTSACYDGCCGSLTYGWDTMAFMQSYGGGCGDIQTGCNQPYVGWGDVSCSTDGEYDTTPGWLMVAGQKGNAALRFADDLYAMFR